MEHLKFNVDRDDLAERLGGGLPMGSLVVIEGPHGAGKSILVQRLVYGLVKNNHSVSLVSTELTTAGFVTQMDSLQYEMEKPMLEERLVFIPVYPLLSARAPHHDLLRRIVQTRPMYSKDVVVFDTLSKFMADHVRSHGEEAHAVEQIEALLYHFKRLTSVGKTIILTLETGQVRDQFTTIFKDSADVFFSLKFELLGTAANRRIVVNRMLRAPGRFGDIIGFRVEPGVGIVIEIKSVV